MVMKPFLRLLLVISFGGALLAFSHQLLAAAGTNSESRPTAQGGGSRAALARFAEQKRTLEERIAAKHELKVPSQVRDFFLAVEKADWNTASNLFYAVEAEVHRSPDGDRMQPFWGAVSDVFGFYELVEAWNPAFLDRFGADLVKSIPPGSIYFGGTANGRFAPSAFSESHTEGHPFFTVTQNALADEAYRGYLDDMYGGMIHIPGTNESQQCFETCVADLKRRWEHDMQFPNEPGQVRRGEELSFRDGKPQIGGQVAVMALNGLIARVIFDKNPRREFYCEESLPLDWMYPYLSPHELIFKVNREPLKELSAEIVRADREFWTRQTDSWLGAWLKTNTPLREIASFVQRTGRQGDLREFKGDRSFLRDVEARQAYAKLRTSIAGLYAWRAASSKAPADRQVMSREADFAFRQALAIYPITEAVYRYVALLTSEGRFADALVATDLARGFDPENASQLEALSEQLRGMNGSSQPSER